MTTHAASTQTTRERPQWLTVSRMLAGEALHHVAWAVGVMVAIVVVASLVARWQGWEIVPLDAGLSALSVEVTASADGVRIVASWIIVVVGAGIAAVVNQIVLASRTRVLVGAGATRRSVAAGLVVSMLTITAAVLALTLVLLLVVGRGPGGAPAAAGAGDGVELGLLLVRLVGGLLLGMAAGMTVVALFQRWHWWVGVVVLAVLVWGLPVVLAVAVPPAWATVEAAAGWWGWELSLAVVMLALYWLVARRVPVR